MLRADVKLPYTARYSSSDYLLSKRIHCQRNATAHSSCLMKQPTLFTAHGMTALSVTLSDLENNFSCWKEDFQKFVFCKM